MKKKLLFKFIAVAIGVLISLAAIELILRVQNFVQLDGFSSHYPGNPVLHHGSNKFSVRVILHFH